MPDDLATRERYMRMALALARKGEGTTSPNPRVGAVLVKGGRVIGTGYHRRAGGPHAEIHALRDAGAAARGADMYVTLEPCCHVGRTPPCVEALAEAGVKRVFIGMQDPNPCVSGNGMVCLTDTNIEFAVGILEDECRTLNERFIKHITTGLPFVLLKGAMTLDGVIATKTGDSKWITSEASRRYAHSLRAGVDAVLVGVGTVLADDPSLTVRMVRPKKGQPLRVVLDSDLHTPENAKLVADGAAETVIFTTSRAPAAKRKALDERPGVSVVPLRSRGGHVSLATALRWLGRRSVQSVLVEGGAQVHASFLAEGAVDRVAFVYAPMIAGGAGSVHAVGGNGFSRIDRSWRLVGMKTRRIGDDLLVEGAVESGA